MSSRARRSSVTTGGRSTMWVLVGALVLLAMAALYVALYSSGDIAFAEDDEPELVDLEVDDPGPADPEAAIAIDLLSVTHDNFLNRDPFSPVVPEPVADTASDDGGSSGDTGGDQPAPTVPSDGDGVCSGPGEEVVCNGRVLTLIGITSREGEPRAVIQVDVNTYEVAEGQRFAEQFQLHQIGDGQVTVLYGDEVIILRTGDRILK